MTRAQLATFIARLIEASGKPLPAEPFDAFVDDWGSAHELSINQLAAVGVVKGRGQHYDPNTTVTRGEMATTVVPAHALIAGSPQPPVVDRFHYDQSSAHTHRHHNTPPPATTLENTTTT